MRRPVKILIWLTASIIALVLFFAFGLPAILRAVLASQLEKNLHRPAAVESVAFNPFSLELTINGLAIREPDNSSVFVSFEQLRVNAEIASVFEGGIDLSEVSLVKPYARVVRAAENQYSFSDLLAGPEKKPEPEPADKPAKPVLFSVANIQITGGSVEFDDRPKSAVHRVTGIELGLPLISNFKQHVDMFVRPSFSATVNGRPFNLTGRTKPFTDSLETTLEINLAELRLPKFLPYVPMRLNFKMPSGSLSTRLELQYVQSKGKPAAIKVRGRADLDGLELVSLEDKPLLGLKSLAVTGIDCAVNSRELTIGEISLKELRVALAREKDGSISLQKLAAPDNATAEKKPAPPEPAPAPAWNMLVKKFSFSGGGITFDDLAAPAPSHMSIDALNFTITNIATFGDSRAELDFTCRINQEASLGLQGAFTLSPLWAGISIDLENLDLRFVQNYMPATVLIHLASGTLGIKGSVDFKQGKNGAPAIAWQGDVRLQHVAASRTGEAEEFLKFAALDLEAMQLATAPLKLDMKTIRLSDFALRPMVGPDGTVNLTGLTAPTPPQPEKPVAAPQKKEKEPLPPVAIGAIVLDKGRVQFTDKSIRPRYSTELADIKGRITGISTKPDSKADIKLGAKLNRYAPLSITGTVSPLAEKLAADVAVAFNNIDLSPFSPYAGKFVGRVIEKGRLSLELKYTIKDNQLTAQNKVFLDQFTLGKSVASKDATSLPVGLAISLLKDRKGEIHLDLPVSGSLDDPSFKVSKVILQTLLNLLEKAATSPFALVGALIPGGADVSTIAFTCGTAELGDEATKKLDAVAGLLAEKTDLSLEIQPVAEADADREGLRREMVMRKLRKLKFNDLSKKEREGLTPEKVVITSSERDDYLWQAYKAEKFEKPKGLLGLPKRLPGDELLKLMAEHEQVDDEDMKELMQSRGLAVKQYLTETAKVPAERLFIIDARLDSGKGEAGCSVEFKLK